MTNEASWSAVVNINEIDSPALLLYPDRIAYNIRRMIEIAGGVERLCPHVKTHKLSQVVKMQIAAGITRFKCATIAEAEMVAESGAADIILAHQPVGPKINRLIKLIKKFPKTKFSTIADDAVVINNLSCAAVLAGITLPVLLDIDCGMHRTGVPAGDNAAHLYHLLATLPGLKAAGFHVYDGHIGAVDIAERTALCEAAIQPALALRERLRTGGYAVPRFVAGGTPSFPVFAKHSDFECSPGTSLLWDWQYEEECPDLKFLHAALVLTRVISKPGPDRLCLDLGHKAIAPEKPQPRVIFPALRDAEAVSHSEEHLVIKTARAGEFKVGDTLFGIPKHICPTVALHSEAVIIEGGKAQTRWPILARARVLTI